LANVAQETPHPVLMADNFNTTDHFHSYRRITAQFLMACVIPGYISIYIPNRALLL
jgi:hypothetical protein